MLLTLLTTPLAADEQTRLPNILLLVADDLGWADVGYHDAEIETPHIDRLAREGVRLEQHYVTPLCSSTRAAMLSGRYPSRYGLLGATNYQVFPFGSVTLASALKSRGYTTGITGKWHLGSQPQTGPLQFGFDRSHGSLAGGVDQYTHFYKDGPYKRTWHRNDQYADETGHATDLFARQAIRWIKADREQPFFIYVAFTAVHVPLQEPRRWLKVYDGKIDEPSRKLYAACATHMDHAIGEIVATVEEVGERENTLILFLSDNGGSFPWTKTGQYGGGHLPCPVLGNNQPLRGGKAQVYEGGIRVPAVVNWPAVLKPAIVDHPLHVVDWFPTLAQLTGFELDDSSKLDGTNVWPLVTGSLDNPGPRTFYWKLKNASAVRRGDWKLVVPANEPAELYNLADDPEEKEDLARQNPQRVAELQKRLAALRLDDRPPPQERRGDTS
jgi:arylsulfatase A-like enzyme